MPGKESRYGQRGIRQQLERRSGTLEPVIISNI